jgi:outer membrane receptor protein involved in Fe transport
MWRRTAADSASKVSAYLIRNQLDLWSDFTYFLNDQVNGDQFAQPDRRVTSGLDAQHTWHAHRSEKSTSDLTVGLQAQNDNIFNGLYSTRARERLSTTREDHIVEGSMGVYVENATRWNERWRTVVGVRADEYRFDVRSSLGQDSGRTSASLASPSASLVYAPWDSTEFYANIGNGFHSNDARGTTAGVDPKTMEAIGGSPGLVRSHGAELGMRTEAIPKMQTSLSLYRLDFDSELTYEGDEGTTEPGAPSHRYGIEFSNYYKPLKWLSLDLDAAFAHARYRGFNPAGSRIPEAIEGVGQLALTADRLGPWSGGLRLRYFGPRPLVEDNSVRSHASLTLNGRAGYRIDKATRVELEGFNLTNRRDSAIDYYYVSRLKNESAPQAGVHFHPIEPRTLRITLVRNW